MNLPSRIIRKNQNTWHYDMTYPSLLIYFRCGQSYRYLVSSWLCWLPYPGFRVNVSRFSGGSRAELVRSCEVVKMRQRHLVIRRWLSNNTFGGHFRVICEYGGHHRVLLEWSLTIISVKMVGRCAVPGCKTTYYKWTLKENGVTLFAVPKTSLSKWQELIPWSNLTSTSRICSRHFDESDFKSGN
jgi:hypothetical protein